MSNENKKNINPDKLSDVHTKIIGANALNDVIKMFKLFAVFATFFLIIAILSITSSIFLYVKLSLIIHDKFLKLLLSFTFAAIIGIGIYEVSNIEDLVVKKYLEIENMKYNELFIGIIRIPYWLTIVFASFLGYLKITIESLSQAKINILTKIVTNIISNNSTLNYAKFNKTLTQLSNNIHVVENMYNTLLIKTVEIIIFASIILVFALYAYKYYLKRKL